MKTNDKQLLKHKLDYLKLSFKISKMRYHGEIASTELLLKALELGSLANIPDDELNSLLLDLTIQGSGSKY